MQYKVLEYIALAGKSYFRNWFDKLGANGAAKVTAALYKMENGNLSNTKSLGQGVWEFKINAGPSYRVYFGKVGSNIILLLAGGTKHQQSKDVKLAKELFNEYKKNALH